MFFLFEIYMLYSEWVWGEEKMALFRRRGRSRQGFGRFPAAGSTQPRSAVCCLSGKERKE